MFMNEEDAFYCLCTVVEDILPGYYATDMQATQVRLGGGVGAKARGPEGVARKERGPGGRGLWQLNM